MNNAITKYAVLINSMKTTYCKQYTKQSQMIKSGFLSITRNTSDVIIIVFIYNRVIPLPVGI